MISASSLFANDLCSNIVLVLVLSKIIALIASNTDAEEYVNKSYTQSHKIMNFNYFNSKSE